MAPTGAQLAVLTRSGTVPAPPARGAHPSAYIVAETGLRLVLPFAPREVSHDGLAPTFTTVEREGRKPLVRRTATGLRTFTFDALLARTDHQAPVEDLIAVLRQLAEAGARMTVSLSALERGTWRLSGVTIGTLLRQHGTNAVTRATASLTFLEAVEAVVNVGPLSGGAVVPPAVPPPPPPPGGGAPSARTYTVKGGDTLSSIAVKFLGNASAWPTIASANRITDPRKLRVGQVLTIPGGAAPTGAPAAALAKAKSTAAVKGAKAAAAKVTPTTLASGASNRGAAGGVKAV